MVSMISIATLKSMTTLHNGYKNNRSSSFKISFIFENLEQELTVRILLINIILLWCNIVCKFQNMACCLLVSDHIKLSANCNNSSELE